MKYARTKKLGFRLCLGLSMFASMMGAACSPSKTPTNSIASATSTQPKTKDDYIKAFNQKVQGLNAVEEQAIMAASVGSVFTDFKKKLDSGEIAALGISVEKTNEAIGNNPQEFEKLMTSKVTLAELAADAKIKSIKDTKVLSAAWQSDLDAFPTEDMWPGNVTANPNMVKTTVIDMSTGAGQKNLQLVGPLSLLTCGASIATGLVSGPLTAALAKLAYAKDDFSPVVKTQWLTQFLTPIVGTVLAGSVILAQHTCL